MVRKTYVFSSFVLFSKLFGFFRDILLVYILGINLSSEIFNFSLGFTSTFSNILGISIYLYFTSIFSKIDNPLFLKKFIRIEFIKLVTLILSFFVFIWFLIPILISILSSIQDQEIFNLTVIIIRDTLVIILFFGISQFLMAYFNSRNRFVIPELTHTSINIFFIISVLLFNVYDLKLIVNLYSFSFLIQTLILLVYFLLTEKKILLEVSISNKILNKETFIIFKKDFQFLFIIISNIITYLNGFLTLSFASSFFGVFVSQNNLAGKINGVVLSVISGSLIAISYPILNRIYKKSNELFQIEIIKVISQLLFIILPFSSFMILFRIEILNIFFIFDSDLYIHIYDVANILTIYLIGTFSVSFIYFFSKVFIINKDYVLLILVPVILIFFNALLFYASKDFLNKLAVPFSSTFSNTLVSVIIIFLYKGFFHNRIYFFFKSFFYIGFYVLVLFLFKQLFDIFFIELNSIIRIIISAVFFISSFFLYSIFYNGFISNTFKSKSIPKFN